MNKREKRVDKARESSLQKLRKAREGGSRLDDLEVPEEAVYEVVDEEEYKQHLEEANDFVVDDGTGEYVDRGVEEEEDDYEEERPKNKKTEKKPPRKRGALNNVARKEKTTAPTGNIGNLLRFGHVQQQNQNNSPVRDLRKKKVTGNDGLEGLLKGLLDNPELEEGEEEKIAASVVAANKSSTGKKRKRQREDVDEESKISPANVEKVSAVVEDMAVDESDQKGENDTNYDLPMDFGDDMEFLQAADKVLREQEALKRDAEQKAKEKEQAAKANVPSIQELNKCLWFGSEAQRVEEVSIDEEVPSAPSKKMPLDENGNLQFYWLDATEEFGSDGILYLFGKVRTKEGRFASCCIKLSGIPRVVYVVPRKFMLDEFGKETTQPVSMDDVTKEIAEEVRIQHKLEEISMKPVTRRYAFERQDVPRGESEFLKVVYSSKARSLPHDISGRTFTHVFGTQTTFRETFILKARLKGPSWLKIRHVKQPKKKVSFCTYEGCVDDPAHISILKTEGKSNHAPPVVVMSLKVMTHRNAVSGKNEIVAATAVVHSQVNVDGATPNPSAGFKCLAFVRPLQDNGNFPTGFRGAVTAIHQPPARQYYLFTNEKGLLTALLDKIEEYDPDILVGHGFVSFDLDVLLHRFDALKVPFWSRLGRLVRAKMPKLQAGAGGMGDSTMAEQAVLSGRLMCDTYHACKELIRHKNYRLEEMARTQLGMSRLELPVEDDGDLSSYFNSQEKLLCLVNHCGNDAFLSLSLVFKLSYIPLTKSLTTVCGNLWSRSMMGARAERIEYLLLHEFNSTKPKYICPDKQKAGEWKGKGRKKAAYKGGLVLDPKRGLYDSHVLIMDFNSLYPSIIREYNICFTTVVRERNPHPEDGREWLPAQEPSPSEPQGILPRVVESLISMRREARRNMEKEAEGGERYQQMDIRQQALKLVANSMYGCLGFSNSRFFALPLAELITTKGRAALVSTREQAERELNLEVIYGDTDSIMVDTRISSRKPEGDDAAPIDNQQIINQVKKIGFDIKRLINKRYKHVEIDIDAILKKMLLLRKKKYAAIMVDSNGSSKREVKGLDLVRREWCDLSKDIGYKLLDLILSDMPKEEVIVSISEYLKSVGEDVRENRIPLQKYVISKTLTKAIEKYADIKSQPHVQVALKLRQQNQRVGVGDTMSYVICKGDAPFAERAYPVSQVERASGLLEIDTEWYLSQQLHPPAARLCEPIEGLDSIMLAQCLGMDTSKLQATASFFSPDGSYDDASFVADVLSQDEEKFKACEPLVIKCSVCHTANAIAPVVTVNVKPIAAAPSAKGKEKEAERDVELVREDGVLPPTLKCPTCFYDGKHSLYEPDRVANILMLACRKFINKYNEHWMKCSSCGKRQRLHMHVLKNKTMRCECGQNMHCEYTHKQLYLQLQYLKSLFDVARAFKHQPEKQRLFANHMDSYGLLSQQMDDVLQNSGYGFVSCQDLFGLVKSSLQ